MTIDEILSNNNSSSELKNKFLEKSTSISIQSRINSSNNYFTQSINNVISSILKNSIISYNGTDNLSEELFNKSIDYVKKTALFKLEQYKKTLDQLFGE